MTDYFDEMLERIRDVHFASTGLTAAELIARRIDIRKPIWA